MAIILLFNAAVWYFFYRLHRKSEAERWERGSGKKHDFGRLRFWYLVSYLLVNGLLWKMMLDFAQWDGMN